jgi:RsiW-degrading membrane proteinase PrsW (M82 family)
MTSAPTIAMLAAILLLAVYHRLVARLEGPRERKSGVVFGAYVVVVDLIVPAALAVGIMSRITSDPFAKLDVFTMSERLVAAGKPEEAERRLRAHLEVSPLDVRAHEYYVWAHFRDPRQSRDDLGVLAYYKGFAEQPERAALSHLGQGLYWLEMKEPEKALAALDSCGDPRFPRISLLRGRALEQLARYDEAVAAYEMARNVPEDRQAALTGLADALVARRDWPRLRAHLQSMEPDEARQTNAWHELQLRDGKIGAHLAAMLTALWRRVGASHVILALLTLAFWFVIIRRWDRCEAPRRAVTAAVLMGALFTYLPVIIHAIVSTGTVDVGNVSWKYLALSVLAIGLVEEGVKIAPVLLLRRFTRLVNTPADWAIYGACSGLGFAIVENLMVEAVLGPHAAMEAAGVGVPFHVSLTALVGLWAAEKEGDGRAAGTRLAMGLFAAAVLHGLYDFLITGPVAPLGLGALVIAAWTFSRFGRRLGAALRSRPFHANARPQSRPTRRTFFRAFASLAVVVFVLQTQDVGVERATILLCDSARTCLLAVLVLGKLTRI